MRANFVWVEPQSRKSNVTIPKPKEGHQVGAGDGFSCSILTLEINTNGSVQFSIVVAQVKKTTGACHHGEAQDQTCELHGN